MSGENELKPCPFCGAQEEVSFGISHSNLFDETRVHHHAECESCGVMGPSCDTTEEALIGWNRRSTPPATETPRESDEYERRRDEEIRRQIKQLEAQNMELIRLLSVATPPPQIVLEYPKSALVGTEIVPVGTMEQFFRLLESAKCIRDCGTNGVDWDVACQKISDAIDSCEEHIESSDVLTAHRERTAKPTTEETKELDLGGIFDDHDSGGYRQ